MRNAVVLLVLVLTATPALADTAAAWAALHAGSAVALMRHADAPGIGDPAGYNVEDCATQRNLSEQGRAQAAAVGALFRANQITVARIISSPRCRCLETARLMETRHALGSVPMCRSSSLEGRVGSKLGSCGLPTVAAARNARESPVEGSRRVFPRSLSPRCRSRCAESPGYPSVMETGSQ